jgi:hypothetical protein
MVKKTESSTGPLPSGGPTTYKEDGVFDSPLPSGGQRLIKKTESSTAPSLREGHSLPLRRVYREDIARSAIYMFLNTYIFYIYVAAYINLGTRI